MRGRPPSRAPSRERIFCDMEHLKHLNRELVRVLLLTREPAGLVACLSPAAAVELRALHHLGRMDASAQELPAFIAQAGNSLGEALGDFGQRTSLKPYLATAYKKLWPDSPLPTDDWSPSPSRA